MRPIRPGLLAACVLFLLAVGLFVWRWLLLPSPIMAPSGEPKQAPRLARSASEASGSELSLAEELVSGAVPGWVEGGVPEHLIESLTEDTRVSVAAITTSDAEEWLGRLESRGAALSDRAHAFLTLRGYLSEGGSLQDAFLSAWSDTSTPGRRIARIDTEHAYSGTSILMGPDEMSRGGVGQLSLFAPPAPHLRRRAQDHEIPTAYLAVPVEFASGETAILRLNFAYDESTKAWFPIRLDAIGTRERLLLLF